MKAYVLDKVKDSLGWYSFKRADLNQSHRNVVDEWSSGNCIQSKYVSQLTRDPLHTDHIKGDEVYFPFWMNALNVYDLFEGD